MKKRLCHISLAFLLILLAFVPVSQACVGRILYIGAIDTPESKLMAELLVTLINERTGTNVKIRFTNNRNDLYAAFKTHDENSRVDIIVENTADAMAHLSKARLGNPDQEYTEAKKLYEKELEVVWLTPFGFKSGSGPVPALSAPLIRQDVLTNFPLLPRILNKLSSAIDTKTYNDLLNKINGGGKPKNVAKDFLKERKFI
jgi:glycine betaine/choline ABC-type transport system substrate-binding protein